MLNDGGAGHDALQHDATLGHNTLAHAGKPTAMEIALRMPPGHVAMLTRRARDADVTRGRYVCGLLDGMPEPPLPADHSVAIAALRASTDCVAAMSTDLNALMRLIGRVPASELESYRSGLNSLVTDVRAHLVQASALIADLTRSRRPRDECPTR
ncbi:hypothetical protein [Roseateles sp.]|uniref:hypothetical protein n=1 Tax=Roseateles sp. TaxID=1971397 RepID=UPI0039ED213B